VYPYRGIWLEQAHASDQPSCYPVWFDQISLISEPIEITSGIDKYELRLTQALFFLESQFLNSAPVGFYGAGMRIFAAFAELPAAAGESSTFCVAAAAVGPTSLQIRGEDGTMGHIT
jgi:hypothetical protein